MACEWKVIIITTTLLSYWPAFGAAYTNLWSSFLVDVAAVVVGRPQSDISAFDEIQRQVALT